MADGRWTRDRVDWRTATLREHVEELNQGPALEGDHPAGDAAAHRRKWSKVVKRWVRSSVIRWYGLRNHGEAPGDELYRAAVARGRIGRLVRAVVEAVEEIVGHGAFSPFDR